MTSFMFLGTGSGLGQTVGQIVLQVKSSRNHKNE